MNQKSVAPSGETLRSYSGVEHLVSDAIHEFISLSVSRSLAKLAKLVSWGAALKNSRPTIFVSLYISYFGERDLGPYFRQAKT